MSAGDSLRVPAGDAFRASDSDLVLAARLGDREAFAELVRRYQGLVRSLGYALTGSLNQSDEIGQETFLVAWRRLSALRKPDRFRAWVCGLARIVVLERRRKDRKQIPPGASPIAVGE